MTYNEYYQASREKQAFYREYDYGHDHAVGWWDYISNSTPQPRLDQRPFGYVEGWEHARLAGCGPR